MKNLVNPGDLKVVHEDGNYLLINSSKYISDNEKIISTYSTYNKAKDDYDKYLDNWLKNVEKEEAEKLKLFLESRKREVELLKKFPFCKSILSSYLTLFKVDNLKDVSCLLNSIKAKPEFTNEKFIPEDYNFNYSFSIDQEGKHSKHFLSIRFESEDFKWVWIRTLFNDVLNHPITSKFFTGYLQKVTNDCGDVYSVAGFKFKNPDKNTFLYDINLVYNGGDVRLQNGNIAKRFFEALTTIENE